MTIDLVLNFFDWGGFQFKLVTEFRNMLFGEAASSELPELIFSYVWAFDDASDKGFIDQCVKTFTDRGAEVYFVKLEATLSERLIRNKSAFRLEKKNPNEIQCNQNHCC